ncbi:nitroreductase family protein [Nonomuraea sp. NBC_00507]|uniref:nitroreductase family protein n=1 Tax=Nonomuraea sp. NBC_00507 TaxID=2976002 RepID=UPI002E18B922
MTNAHALATELIQAFRVPPDGMAAVAPAPVGPAPIGPDVRAGGHAGSRADLLDTLVRRRSQRFFAQEPIPAELLADVIVSGIRDDADAWPGEQPLQTDVVAFDVAGVEPAMFRFDAGRRVFSPVAPLPPPDELENLTLQTEFCHAPAIVSIAVDLTEADRAHGAHGYRLVLGRAGAAAYTMWLEAIALGLAGTVFAGFIPAAVRRPLRADGTSRHHVFALAVGRELRDQRRE